MSETPIITPEVVDDERGGLASASSMKRTRRCPGWLNLSKTIPKQEGGADADAGTSRHGMIELEIDPDTVDDKNEAYVLAQSARLREKAIAMTFGAGAENVRVAREERLWLFDEHLERVCSARLDWVGVKGDTGLICDYKTLYGFHAHAAENEQLATQAVLAGDTYDLSTVRVALIQPNLPTEQQLTMAEFTRTDLVWAKVNVMRWCFESSNPHAPRIPGPTQCEHCPCRAYCPEAIAAEMAITITDARALSEPQVISALLDGAALAIKVATAIQEKAKRMIGEGVEIPGWGIKEGGVVRKITNAAALASILAEAGATTAQINTVAKIGITDADELYGQLRKGEITQMRAREELEAKLLSAGAMEKAKKKSSLIRLKQ